jgi:lysine/ornithine N-monooxygenase
MIIKPWNLQTVLMNGEPFSDSLQFHLTPKYTYYFFSYSNSLNVATIVHGGYTESSDGFYEFVDKSTIRMRFTLLYNRHHITAKIKKLTRTELHLEYEEGGGTYYLKLYSN